MFECRSNQIVAPSGRSSGRHNEWGPARRVLHSPAWATDVVFTSSAPSERGCGWASLRLATLEMASHTNRRAHSGQIRGMP